MGLALVKFWGHLCKNHGRYVELGLEPRAEEESSKIMVDMGGAEPSQILGGPF